MATATLGPGNGFDLPYGKAPGSMRRFSLFKWLVAGLLAMLLIYLANGRPDDGFGAAAPGAPVADASRTGTSAAASSGAASGAASPAAAGGELSTLGALPGAPAAAEIFAILRQPDGGLVVRGHLPDEATRNVWMNAIRLGAQQLGVTEGFDIGAGAAESAQWYGLWAAHLQSLTATLRAHDLSGLIIEGNRVVLRGQVPTTGQQREIERLVQANIPPGFRLESQLVAQDGATAIAAADSASTAASTVASSPLAGAPLAGAPLAGAPLAGSGSASAPAASGASQPGVSGAPLVSAGSARSTTSAAQPGAPSPLTGSGLVAGATGAARSGAKQAGAAATGAAAAGTAMPPAARAAAPVVACPRALASLAGPVYFETDSFMVSEKDRRRLEQLGACLGKTRLRVVGRTDPRHTEAYNQALSERRARSVADLIGAGGGNVAQLTIVGAGVARVSGRQTQTALQRSRRVDIQIR